MDIQSLREGKKSVGMAFTSVNSIKPKVMAIPSEDKKGKKLPETTQKKDGTTSAFSAASMQQKKDNGDDKEPRFREDGTQGKASFYPGTTTQGGSNFGQGSSSLGPSSYKQGSERNKGTNYENEIDRFAETGTQAAGDNTRKDGGTDNEHDDLGEREERMRNNDETLGIP